MKRWAEKIKEINAAAHIQDAHTVGHYIKKFNKHYREHVKDTDMREVKENILLSVCLRESPN